MKKIAKIFLSIPVHYPKSTLFFLALITLIAAAGIPKLQFENSLDVMMPHGDIEYITNEKVKEIYGNNGKFIILDINSDKLMTPAAFTETDNLITDIEEYIKYNEDKENLRSAKITSLIEKNEKITSTALKESLSDDSSFSRAVMRKLGIKNHSENIITTGMLRNMQKSLDESREIKKKKYVDTVLSPFTMKDVSGKDDTLTTYDIMVKDKSGKRILPQSEEEFKLFENRLRLNPAFKNGIYHETSVGKITDFGIFIRLTDANDLNEIAHEIRSISESYNGTADLKITVQGAPVLYRQIADYMQSDLKFFVPLVLLVICFIFYLNFRTLQGVLIPLTTLLMADAWVLGLMGHLGYKISVIGISLPPLIISVGSSYSIHIMNRFIIDSEKIKADRTAGLYSSMQMIGMTLMLASITTIIGFMTNMATQVSSIFEWGLFSALGTTFAVVIAALFIPAVFRFIELKVPAVSESVKSGKSVKDNNTGLTDRILFFCAESSVHHPRTVLTITFVLVLISVAGIFQMKSETSLQSYFKPSDYINRSSCEIGRKFGGTMGLNILIDSGETDGVKDPEFLNRIEEMRKWLISPENSDLHVGRTDAFGDFVKTINMAMHNDDPSYYTIPDSKSELMDYFEIYSGDDENSDGRIDEFEPYVDPEFRTVNLFARLSESEKSMLGTSDINNIVSRIRGHFESSLSPHGYKITISGEPLIIISLAKYVVQGQMWSLFLSLAAVSLIVMVLFKNIKAGVVSSVPIITAVIVNFGLMGWTGIRLDIATAIIASITVGIGVDNTIHFLNTYRHVKTSDTSIDEAIHQALTSGGKAIIFTAVALIAGFSVLAISQFKPILLFGLMMGFTFIATTAGALLILPAVIKVTEFTLEENGSKVSSGVFSLRFSQTRMQRTLTESRYFILLNNYAKAAMRGTILRILNSKNEN